MPDVFVGLFYAYFLSIVLSLVVTISAISGLKYNVVKHSPCYQNACSSVHHFDTVGLVI